MRARSRPSIREALRRARGRQAAARRDRGLVRIRGARRGVRRAAAPGAAARNRRRRRPPASPSPISSTRIGWRVDARGRSRTPTPWSSRRWERATRRRCRRPSRRRPATSGSWRAAARRGDARRACAPSGVDERGARARPQPGRPRPRPVHAGGDRGRDPGRARRLAAQRPADVRAETACRPLQAVDYPVCGMAVAVADTAEATRWTGVSYYFCCAGCRERFEHDPTPYLTEVNPSEGRPGHPRALGRRGAALRNRDSRANRALCPARPGAVLAVSEKGEVAGSVTGGCVEPAVYEEAQAVLAGGPPRLARVRHRRRRGVRGRPPVRRNRPHLRRRARPGARGADRRRPSGTSDRSPWR